MRESNQNGLQSKEKNFFIFCRRFWIDFHKFSYVYTNLPSKKERSRKYAAQRIYCIRLPSFFSSAVIRIYCFSLYNPICTWTHNTCDCYFFFADHVFSNFILLSYIADVCARGFFLFIQAMSGISLVRHQIRIEISTFAQSK